MGLRGGGVRTVENKGHAHLQYSVAVFLGDVSTAVITQLAGVLQSLPGYFGEKNCRFCQESTCVIVSSQNYLLFCFSIYSQASVLEGSKLKFYIHIFYITCILLAVSILFCIIFF